ncbi:unnamed protein product [Rhizophagus irregularis]|nr:unnamed protein product [Rhizophagus irregularis]
MLLFKSGKIRILRNFMRILVFYVVDPIILIANDTIKIDGKYIIDMPNITPQAFDVIITYFYTGHINMTNKTGAEILNMMIAFDELKLNQLIKLAEDYLIEHRKKFLQNDPIEFLQIINSHKVFNSNIRELCLKNIYSDPNILFNSVKFINLSASLLEIILKQDDLILNEIDEIKIWENLIKWGLAKDEILDEDVSKWNQEKFNIFEKIIYNFIQLIRFYDISSEDYFNKVKPYEQILSKESRDDIIRFHMTHKSLLNKYSKRRLRRDIDSSLIITGTVDSSFINKEHIVLFANWIERKGNNRNVGSGIISRPINNNGTVISDPNYGPYFDNDLYLSMQYGICYSNPKSYADINIPNILGIDDYEVFQVKKELHSKL